MDHIRILKRAFEIVRRYKVLWIFGFLIALTTSRGGGSSNTGYQFGSSDFDGKNGIELPFLGQLPQFNYSPDLTDKIIGVIIGVTCLALLLAVVFTVISYVSRTSVIRMVDRYEAIGEKVGFRQGWRLGWTRAAFRMWLVDLLFGLAAIIIILAFFLIAVAPLLLWTTNNDTVGVIGTVATVGLVVLAILLAIIIGVAVSLLAKFFHRAVALENLGVFDSIRRGWEIVRRRTGDVIVMGLILFGIGLLFSIVMIPVFLFVAFSGVIAAGLPALLAGGITNIFTHGSTPQIVALVIGIPIFLTVLFIPLSFINGLFEAFTSSAWTLAYREIVALETTQKAESE